MVDRRWTVVVQSLLYLIKFIPNEIYDIFYLFCSYFFQTIQLHSALCSVCSFLTSCPMNMWFRMSFWSPGDFLRRHLCILLKALNSLG